MPIYEFKCLKCKNCFEFLFMNNDEKIQTKCPKCGAEDFERVLSTTNYNIPGSSTGKTQASSTTHSCETGSCTTYDIPGPG